MLPLPRTALHPEYEAVYFLDSRAKHVDGCQLHLIVIAFIVAVFLGDQFFFEQVVFLVFG